MSMNTQGRPTRPEQVQSPAAATFSGVLYFFRQARSFAFASTIFIGGGVGFFISLPKAVNGLAPFFNVRVATIGDA